MKKIISILHILFSRLFSSEALSESPIPQDEAENVYSGLDAVISQAGETVAFATGVNIDENFNLQGIKTLGFHGDRGFKSTDYNCRLTVDALVPKAGTAKALNTSTRDSILTDAAVDFTLTDPVDGTTIKTVQGCKLDSKSERWEAGQLVTRNTNWFGRTVKPTGEAGVNE